MSLKQSTPEKEVQSACLAECRAAGVWVRRRNVAGARPFAGADGKVRRVQLGHAGDADLWGVLPESWPFPGRHVEIEVKAPGKRPTPKQMQFLLEQQAAGAFALWTDEAEWLRDALDLIRCGLYPVLAPDGEFVFCRPEAFPDRAREVRLAINRHAKG